jgi:HTH-type transcriptional regulator/antitoxin HipB
MYLRTPADLGSLIRERRRKLGLDQQELARRAGVSRLWLSQVERGKPRAALDLVLRTLQVLGVRLLVEGERQTGRSKELELPDVDAVIARARGEKV